MYARHWMRCCRTAVTLLVLVLVLTATFASPGLAQTAPATPAQQGLPAQAAASALTSSAQGQSLPVIWYLFAAALAMLVPAGFVLLAAAGLDQNRAWNAALGGLAAAGLAAVAYWAVGFALHFGGVGLVYSDPALSGLVLEWSPLSSEWGIGWGMAGLSGWFLSGGNVTALAYSLFLAHLPWVMLAALLPVMALRGRAPSTVTLLLAVMLGGVVFPLAGNWVQGGGWLNALGRNMGLGHGFVDAGGAGSVHLVAAGFALAALTVWSTRRSRQEEVTLPPAHQPLLAVVGALMLLAGAAGWVYANPLQTEAMGALGMMRGAVALALSAAGGLIVPLVYTWFVTGSSDPTMTARGFAAGLVAGLATTPFVQPGVAFAIGFVAGGTVPFVAYLLDGRLRVQDRTGVVVSSGVPAIVGLLLVGVFADGSVGAGWQQTGVGTFLGVTGQGVAGLTVSAGFQPDFPGQLQAQIIGAAALGLWGFLAGILLCVPLGLIFHSLLQRDAAPGPAPVASAPPWGERAPTLESGRGAPALPYASGFAATATEPALANAPSVRSDASEYSVEPVADPFAAAPYAYEYTTRLPAPTDAPSAYPSAPTEQTTPAVDIPEAYAGYASATYMDPYGEGGETQQTTASTSAGGAFYGATAASPGDPLSPVDPEFAPTYTDDDTPTPPDNLAAGDASYASTPSSGANGDVYGDLTPNAPSALPRTLPFNRRRRGSAPPPDSAAV